MWWDLVDKIIFINLDHRKDRLVNMNEFFQEAEIPSEKIIRFPAIRENPGTVGCAKSHIAVIKMIRYNGWDNTLILEDDVKWVNYSNEILLEHIQQPFDVLMLGGLYCALEGNRVINAWHTSSYIIKKHYLPKLLDNFETGLYKLIHKRFIDFNHRILQINNDHKHHIDLYWCYLQRDDNWRCINPPMVIQSGSYSDIK
jgi:glycosyl transferase, family 25